jgi:hypothetical protein
MKGYYQNPAVLARIVEYLGGSRLEEATCMYVAQADRVHYNRFPIKSPQELGYFLSRGLDIGRSLWDRRYLLAHLDIEYLNLDSPAEPYLHPQRSLELQEPVIGAGRRILEEYGIRSLHLLTGRGHHLVWQVDQESGTFERLRRLGRVPPSLERYDRRPHPPAQVPVPHRLSAAFAGLSLVMEFLAHRIKREAGGACRLPVEISDVPVRPSERGRELILLDISEYHDPLHTRTVRIPFTVYRKPWAKGMMHDPDMAERIELVLAIPRLTIDIGDAVALRRDFGQVAELAGTVSTAIPVQHEAMDRLIEDYERSALRRFHDWFYAEETHPPERWERTYDHIPRRVLPPCVRRILEDPHDRLCQRMGVRLVIWTMLALGWHPRHIAGLIRSRYERDDRQGQKWREYDPGFRAEHYTRIFSGLFAAGFDDLQDFDCGFLRANGLCAEGPCRMKDFRRSLIGRREHERLGGRPVNRLFLPETHL